MFKKSTKKLQLITLAILILLSSLPVVSASAEISQKVTDQGICYEINNEEITITGCAENIKDVVIPQTIEGYPVTSIGYRAFSAEMAYHSIESIEIPEGVIIIEDLAFECCMDLKSVTIPSTLTHIGLGGFFGCNYIEKVYISDLSAWLNIETLDSPLNCENNAILYLNNEILTDVTIPNGITKIPNYAFSYTSLERITIPDSVTSIGISAFSNCNNLSYVFFNGTEEQWNSITISPNGNSCLTNADIYFEYYVFTDPYEPTDVYPTYWETEPYEPTDVYPTYWETDPYESTDVYPTYWETDPYEPTDVYPTYWETDPYEPTDVYPTDVYETTIPIIPDGFQYEIEGTHAAVIVSYKGYAEDLVIPDYIDGYPVRTISPSVFRDCTTLKSITLPKYLTEIGWYSFENCINLESITIPEGVTELGPCTFNGCTNLKSIVLPDGLKHISWNVFTNCTNLEYIDIPDNLSFLCSKTFTNTPMYNNENNWENDVLYIDSVLIEAKDTINGTYNVKPGTKLIAQDAFNDCKNLKCVTIPFGINRLISRTFYGCTNLESITIPDSVTYIDLEVFYECTSLTDVYYYGTAEEWDSIEIDNSNTCLINADIHSLEFETTIPPTTAPTTPPATEETVPPTTVSSEQITPDGFKYEITNTEAVIVDYLGNETEVIIPKNIDSYPVVGINPHVFEDQVNITAVFIPDTVISIGYCAFKNCTNIKSIVIPESVMYVDVEAFANCVNLKNIIIEDKTKYISASAFVNTAFYNNTDNWEDDVLYLDSVLLKAKESISGAYEIKNDTIRIASGAFRNCTKLESITIPNGIKTIGMGTFSNCSSLKDVIIPESLTGIGDDAFTGCTKLENVYISDIGAWIEMGYGSPDSNPLYYADNLYLNNELVNSLKIPDGVTYITNQAFSCTNLERIEIPESVTQFEMFAFDGCENLTDIYYNGIKEQWNEIFIGEYNESLENITIHFNSTLPTEPSSSVPELNFEIGDVNRDNKLNIKDVTAIQKLLAKLLYFDDVQIVLADFNGDKNINVKDATTIQKKIAGFEV